MKKSLIIFTLLLTFSYVNSQENKSAAKRASNAVTTILSEIELSDEKAKFLEKTLYTKYADNALKIKGKNLSQDEKKNVYRNAFKSTRKVLRKQFSEAEVKSIIRLERQANKK
tara:strand:- start:120 stop:458 length:339 start_codon:yes stop_codon:yes gene_type:complete